METPPNPGNPVNPVQTKRWADDIHVNASGAVFFVCELVGIIWPEAKPKAQAIAMAAGIYLFGAAKSK